MALWGLTDALVDAPKWLTPKFTFDGADVTGGVFTIENHSIKNGDQITFANGTGTLGGIAVGTLWHAKVLTTSTFELYSNADLSTGKVTPTDALGTGHTVQVTPSDVYFADVDEVQVAENIARGFHVPGWYRYSAGTRLGVPRHDVELLCAFSAGGSEVADTDDTGIVVGSDDDAVLED